MLPRERVGNRHAITLRSPVDDRVMFVLPWGDFTYVGTTDTDYQGDPAAVAADSADVQYLLTSANAAFPGAHLTERDVVSTWAGLRPLLAPPQGVGASATSREHEIWWDPSGLLNIAGGKLTTYRVMARELVDEAVRGAPHDGHFGASATSDMPLPGAPGPAESWEELQAEIRETAEEAGLGREEASSLARRHGADARAILRLLAEDPGLRERIVPGLPYILAEVVFAVRAELALTLDDVMVRRTHLFYEWRSRAAASPAQDTDSGRGAHPAQASTGSRGYFGNRGSTSLSSQR
jgi:glycerol-3-phosphate dehydrogenase